MKDSRPKQTSTLSRQYLRTQVSGRVIIFSLIISFVFVLAIPTSLSAQFYFGKNKVQYDRFEWQVMSTEHFRIYFYTEAYDVAAIAAKIAEESYHELAAQFNYEFRHPIPLILYSLPSHFSQTNTTQGLLPESVGGFTEFLKRRVVLPFNGNFSDLRHVVRHELVHAFQLAKTDAVGDRLPAFRAPYPPLWLSEGQAECWSEEWDTEADMIMKDLILEDQLPSVSQLGIFNGSYFIYKTGQSLCRFIELAYGRDKLTLMFELWPKAKSFDQLIELTLGVTIEKLSSEWHYALKKKYFPELESRGLARNETDRLTRDGFCVEGVPIRWDDGRGKGSKEWVVYLANKLGYTSIYLQPRVAGGNSKILVKGERTAQLQSLHLLRTGIDASDRGMVVFSAKDQYRDALNLYDLAEERIVRRYTFPNIVEIRSPRFSSNDEKIVFVGFTTSGFGDLYLLNRATDSLTRLTSNQYFETDPAFSTDDQKIIFSSDQGEYGQSGSLNLFSLSLADTSVVQLTFGKSRDLSPEPIKRGILYSSDRDGAQNLYLLKDDGSSERLSTLATGAYDPRLASDDSTLVFTGFQQLGYHVYQTTFPDTPTVFPALAENGSSWKAERIDSSYVKSSVKYATDYSLDVAQSAISYDPVGGSLGGFQAVLSDMLGNHSFYFLLTNTAEGGEDFLTSFNVGVTYLNKKNRLNWGAGVFHLYDEYYNDVDQYYFERQVGGVALASYPVSRFSRFDLSFFGRYSTRQFRFGLPDRNALLGSSFLSYVYDNSLWDQSGPIEGRRYNLTTGVTYALDKGQLFATTVSADLRHYLRLGTYSAFASRLYYFQSDGEEPQRLYFGGSWNFRGYDRRQFYTRHIAFASHELRFPLIDDLRIGLPIGPISFQGIRGALFGDVGSAWEDEKTDWLGSYGAGVRVSLGYLVLLRLDFSYRTDFKQVEPLDVDFFFGWNF